jgi:hypothetical protein
MADGSTLSDLKGQQKKAANSRAQFERDWYLNLAYFFGDQWVFWNRRGLDRPRLDNAILEVDNRILPIITTRIARKTKTRPVFVATPSSYDASDLDSTELATQILDYDWGHLNLSLKLFNALLWADVCCAGFWKIYWDSTKGESNEFLFSDNGPVMNDGRPVKASQIDDLLPTEGLYAKTVARGDVRVDVISPFEIYPDPLADDLESAEFIIEEKVRSVEYVKQKYNKEVQPDSDVPGGIVEGKYLSAFRSEPSGDSTAYKGVTVYELWEKPSSKNAKGRRAAWTKNEVLVDDTLDKAPYVGCPYVMFSAIEAPGRFWPTSVTTQMRGPQTGLNKMKSQIRQNAVRLGNPSFLSSRQANVEYYGVPGEHVKFDSTTPDSVPSYLTPPPIPVYVENEIERLENSLAEISGVHEVSKASVPSGITAASAINLLQEADDTRLGPETTMMENTIGSAGEKIIQLRAKFMMDHDIIVLAGEDGEWNIREFRKNQLNTDQNIDVQAGSQLPASKAARQAAMTEFLTLIIQNGLPIDERDLRRFMREYGVGGLESMFASMTESERQVKREHNRMLQGEAIDINDYDDDDIHVEGRTKQYELASPQVQAIVDLHVEAHEERQRQVKQAMFNAQQPPMVPDFPPQQ